MSLYRLGELDTIKTSKNAKELAQDYWQVTNYYITQTYWDSAYQSLAKAKKLFPIDSILRNDVNGKLALAQLEMARGNNLVAGHWAQSAFTDANLNYTVDSIGDVARHLQRIYSTINQPDIALRYQYFADSLKWESDRTKSFDSLTQLRFTLRETQRRVEMLEQRLKASEEEKNRWFYYALIPLAAAALVLLIAIIYLLVRKPKLSKSKNENSNSLNNIIERSATHNLIGYADLLMQRGRTGEDLVALKAMERELQRLQKFISVKEVSTKPLDDDYVLRSLKNIRLLIFSDNPDSTLLLKSWLRKRIRLCEIHDTQEAQDFIPDVLLVDIDNTTDSNLKSIQHLKINFTKSFLIVLTATENSFSDLMPDVVLQKPFDQNILLEELTKRYKLSTEATPIASPNYSTYVTEQSTALDLAIKHQQERLHRAYVSNDMNDLVKTCQSLDSLLQRAGVNASKWLDVLANKPAGITTMQTELAFKNVTTYCKQAIERLQQPN